MKSEFGKESLAYLGHMISGRVQKVHPTKIEAINKWSTPNSEIEVICEKVHFHILNNTCSTTCYNKKREEFSLWLAVTEVFLKLKRKVSDAPMLTMTKLKKPFEVEMDAIGDDMGPNIVQERRLVCYHSKLFHGAMLNYTIYDKDLFSLV